MKAIVLAGGRGKRLGIRGNYAQKGSLPFQDQPLITYILDNLLANKGFEEILIATGYRGQDIRRIISKRYPKYLKAKRLRVLDFPLVKGNFSRLAAVFSVVEEDEGYFLCGIDSIVPQSSFEKFWYYLRRNKDYPCLLLSPRLEVAPTHGLVVLKNGFIEGYQSLNRTKGFHSLLHCHCVDTGIRYFPMDICLKIKKEGTSAVKYIPHFIAKMVQCKKTMKGMVFQEEWRHFASAQDFL